MLDIGKLRLTCRHDVVDVVVLDPAAQELDRHGRVDRITVYTHEVEGGEPARVDFLAEACAQ